MEGESLLREVVSRFTQQFTNREYTTEYILLDIMSRVIGITIQEQDERDIGEVDTVPST